MLGQHRSTQRRIPEGREDEARLTADIIELARRHGRLGYRKITEMCGQELAGSSMTNASSASGDERG